MEPTFDRAVGRCCWHLPGFRHVPAGRPAICSGTQTQHAQACLGSGGCPHWSAGGGGGVVPRWRGCAAPPPCAVQRLSNFVRVVPPPACRCHAGWTGAGAVTCRAASWAATSAYTGVTGRTQADAPGEGWTGIGSRRRRPRGRWQAVSRARSFLQSGQRWAHCHYWKHALRLSRHDLGVFVTRAAGDPERHASGSAAC